MSCTARPARPIAQQTSQNPRLANVSRQNSRTCCAACATAPPPSRANRPDTCDSTRERGSPQPMAEDCPLKHSNFPLTPHHEASQRRGTQRLRFRNPSKRRFSGARRAESMCAVRAFGLLEYMRLRGTQRIRFRIPPKGGFSSARRREAMRTGRTPKARTAREPSGNAADEVPHHPSWRTPGRERKLRP